MTDETHGARRPIKRLIAALIIVALIGLFISLGQWQLRRAEEKRQAQKNMLLAEGLPALGVESLTRPADTLRFRQVRLRGVFEQDRQILLDNRKSEGRVGYQVISPLHIEGSDYRVLVNRGWVPQGPHGRSQLPEVETPLGVVEVSGEVSIPVGKRFRPGISAPGNADGGVWLYLDIEYLAAAVQYPLAGFVIQQNSTDEHGFVRDWPKPEFDDGMHIAYAVQWFAFAGFLVMSLLWGLVSALRKRKNNGERND